MKLTRILLFSWLFSLCSLALRAQEHYDHLVPLKTNPVLVRYVKEAKKKHIPIWRTIGDSIMATLPFLDDFSTGGPYPNEYLWMDNAAFINTTYPVCPHTIGVATLDGLNNEGQPYNPNCPPGASYPADSLTSRPINMSVYNQGDSIWLSFYWQAGGIGYAPLTADTLLLQIRTSSTPWTTFWFQLGYTPSPPDTGMHIVMIPIRNNMIGSIDSGVTVNPFDPNFQFRFKNYACTSGDVDQWNIDEVYLNQFRSFKDTAQGDVSWVYECPSLLANYQYMPWEQFSGVNDLKDTMYVPIRNNSSTSPIPIIDTSIISTSPTIVPTYTMYTGGYGDVNEFYSSGYGALYSQTHIPIKSNYKYTALTGPDTVTLTNIIYPSSPDFITSNNILKFNQAFSNFYAYDDGTAEAAYFINGVTPMYLAYGFTLNKGDTLRGLELYFNYMFVNPNDYAFRLALWDNTGPGGSPGNLLFEDDTVYNPVVSDSLNGFTFYPYHFVHPDTVLTGTFYVGWVQTYGDSLNIGYDLNTNSQNQIYYNIAGVWYPGDYPGSMMMRPVFGKPVLSHGPVHQSVATNTSANNTISIYPNPATSEVTLSLAMPPNTTLKIFTADGREWLSSNDFYGNSINTETLQDGFYIMELTTQAGTTYYQKLLIQR